MAAFVNELSFVGQADNPDQCAALIEDLVKVINIILPHLGSKPVYASETLWSKEISSGYTMFKFIDDNRIDKSLTRAFISIVTKGPYFEDLLQNLEHECVIISTGDDVKGSCIAAASHMSGLLTSLKDSKYYDDNPVKVNYKEGNEECQEIEITNILNSSNANKYVAEYIKGSINSWDTFWDKRESLLPELVFCECVKSQLDDVNYNADYPLIYCHLQRMNDYKGNVRKKLVTVPDYRTMGIDATHESKRTLAIYGKERTFVCPDGKDRLFSWHSKQLGPNIRIHFYPPDNTTDKFYIGYIGIHLRTINDPH